MAVNRGENTPSFILYGPHGSGLSTALQAFRHYQYLTLAGVSPESMDRFLIAAAADSKPVVIMPDIDPYTLNAADVTAFFDNLKKQHPELQFFYLSSPTETLINRFSAANKKHPYERDGLRNAIEREQLIYKALKPFSNYHVDTSSTTDVELGLKIAKVLGVEAGKQPMSVHLTSFGFKNGVPTDAEMVFDMRFLPNPFYEEALRPKTGLDKPVSDYVFNSEGTLEFLKHWQNLLSHSLPLFQQQGKTRITIGIGCTGGQHRSVAMTMALADYLREVFPDYKVRIVHREQSHWPQETPTPQRQ